MRKTNEELIIELTNAIDSLTDLNKTLLERTAKIESLWKFHMENTALEIVKRQQALLFGQGLILSLMDSQTLNPNIDIEFSLKRIIESLQDNPEFKENNHYAKVFDYYFEQLRASKSNQKQPELKIVKTDKIH